jgi:hypothetical protein
MYFDKRNDITADVIFNLNRMYESATGTAAGTTKAAARPTAPGGSQPAPGAAQPDNGN